MKPSEMVQRLKDGEQPIDLSIQKWQDIVDGTGGDLASSNCALCDTYTCHECPLTVLMSDKCNDEGSTYDRYLWYEGTDETKRAKDMVKLLKKCKKAMTEVGLYKP